MGGPGIDILLKGIPVARSGRLRGYNGTAYQASTLTRLGDPVGAKQISE